MCLLCVTFKVDIIMHLIVWPFSKDSHNKIRINYLCVQEMKQKKKQSNYKCSSAGSISYS